MKIIAMAVAAACVILPAAAHAELDFDSIVTQGPPASGTPEAAEFCAALSLYLEFNTNDKDAITRDDDAAYMWAGVASGLKGDDLEDYMFDQIMTDAAGVNGLIQGDPGGLGYYQDYCDKEAAARKP